MLVGYIMLFLAVVALLPWGSDFPSVQIPSMSYFVLFVFKIFISFLIFSFRTWKAIEPGHRNSTTSPHYKNTTRAQTSTEEPPRGCPLDYAWCLDTPIIQLYQFLIGLVLLVSGYSMANVMSFAIYSKLLGPKPQVYKKTQFFIILIF